MSKLITAYVLYNGSTNVPYVANPKQVSLNCLQFAEASPTAAWLKRKLALGVAGGSMLTYGLTFDENDPEIDNNTLSGVAVQQGATLYFIDAVSVANVIATCDACCDAGSTAVTTGYPSGIPDFVSPTTSTYNIVREDDGTPNAFDRFSIDYMNVSVNDPVFVSRADGETTYQVTAFGTPTLVGEDTLA
jgi:hypothetical protein